MCCCALIRGTRGESHSDIIHFRCWWWRGRRCGSQCAASTPGQEAVVFVHGYNNGFAKAAYRHAQVAWDYELKGPQIHFSWSSAANPFEYTYDRDSVLIARDALATLLRRLLREDGLRVSLVGHSMGGLLIMETLRQIALSGDRALLDRLSATTLISPDIDMDLFRAQAHALGLKIGICKFFKFF